MCAFVSLEGGDAPPLCGCCCCGCCFVVVCLGGTALPPEPAGLEAPPLPVDVPL